MKYSHHLLIAAAVCSASISALAGEPDKLGDAIAFPDSASRWSFSAGASVRSVDANLHLNAPQALNWRAYVPTQGNKGYDPGLFTGGTGTVKYADGQVGPDYQLNYGPGPGPGGDALGVIENASQVHRAIRQQSLNFGWISEIDFHSSQTMNSYSSGAKLHGADAADSDVGVGPFVTLSYALFTTPKSTFSLMAGWSYVQSNHGTGLQALGIETVTQTHTRLDHTYAYDYDSGFGGGAAADQGSVFPYDASSIQATAGYIVYNPQLYFGTPDGGGFLPPRESTKKTVTNQIIAVFVPVASSSLHVTLNEIVLAPQFERIICPWFRVGVAAGATLNVLNTTMDTQLNWYQQGRSAPVFSSQWHEDSSTVKVGMMGQLNVTVDLTKRLFLEAHGSYRWVNPIQIASGPATAKINATSWEGGLGFGIRF